MKRLLSIVLFVAMAIASGSALAFTKNMYPYEKPDGKQGDALHCIRAEKGMDLELGKWYTNFAVCKDYADKHGLPMVAIWSNTGCIHCWYTDVCFTQQAFLDWKAISPAGQVIYCFMAGGHDDIDQELGTSYNWMRYEGGNTLNAYPFVAFWWKQKGINEHLTGDNLIGAKYSYDLADKNIPQFTERVIAKMESVFAGWSPAPAYAGGYFATTNEPYATPQAEAGTKQVIIDLTRTATTATNQTMTIARTGKTESLKITWPEGVTEQQITIGNFDTNWFSLGKDVTLSLLDGEGGAVSKLAIPCVATENSADNPAVSGCSKFGEWTMDLEAAKEKAKLYGGKAYTLVAVQGSLWCPDCANVERNFLGLKDASGNNRFSKWAASKNIALVSIDIPNFNSEAVDCESPSLLKRTQYKTRLARPDEYPQSGAEANLTNYLYRSGIGYMTRKNLTEEKAAEILKRNHDLVTLDTDEGGFHRPEDGSKFRTGVPIFVLLRKDGTVAARLTRMAAVSPMKANQADFDSYIKRFEEMIEIAENDATEIENNYAGEGAIPFDANGGEASNYLCSADTVDTFFLRGVGGNALQKITVKGDEAVEDDATVKVALVKLGKDGKQVELTSKEGLLSTGISFDWTFTEAGEYYAQVSFSNFDTKAFKLESTKEKHFQNYKISGNTIVVPQEDQASAKAPAGSDKVVIRLVEGTVYKISGMKACAQLEQMVGAKVGFYLAKAGGDFEATVTEVGGTLTYQIWKPGTAGFDKTAQTVPESVCGLPGEEIPLKIALKRKEGKSGKIVMKVEEKSSSLLPYRYSFETQEITWEDGDIEDKDVEITIYDDLLFDGMGIIELKATIVESEAGDVVVEEGKDIFKLTVVEDDKQSPGKAYISRTEPDFENNKKIVYARESEGMKFYARRIEGSDGLVAAILTSSYKDTEFETKDGTDLKDIGARFPEIKEYVPEGAKFLYWASRDGEEKWVKVTGIPAGKTANIYFTPVKPLGTISASNMVTIVSIPDDAPGFAETARKINATRYVELSAGVEITDISDIKNVGFTKISGTLPAGVKVSVGMSAGGVPAFAITGVPTAKAGTYEAVYQIKEKQNGKWVKGMPITLTFDIVDVTKAPIGMMPINPSIAKTRTFKNVMVVEENEKGEKRLDGMVQLTVPPSGRVSARYTCGEGTIALSAKNWMTCNADMGTLATTLVSKKGYEMEVTAKKDGSVDIRLEDPDGNVSSATISGQTWKKNNSAEAWKNYYTVAIKGEGTYGYMTLKMATQSACNSGTFTVAGILPNGTRFSGSYALEYPEAGVEQAETAILPIYKKLSKGIFAAAAEIIKDAEAQEIRRCVNSPDNWKSYWTDLYSDEAFTLHGSYYNKDDDLHDCCAEDHDTYTFNFYLGDESLTTVTVDKNSKLVLGGDNPQKVTLNLNRNTGVITGSFKNPELGDKTVSYAGAIILGWGGCGCAPGEQVLPFMCGNSKGDVVTIDVDNK